ncbi:MAG: hypothetical protein V1820_01220 [archaeon]
MMRKGGTSEPFNWLFVALLALIIAFVLLSAVLVVSKLWSDRENVEPPKTESLGRSASTLCSEAITDSRGIGDVDFAASGEAQYSSDSAPEIRMLDFARGFSEVKECFPSDSCIEFAPDGSGSCTRRWNGAVEIDFVDVCAYYSEDFEGLAIHIVCTQDCDRVLTGLYNIEAKKVLPGHTILPDFCLFFSPLSETTSEEAEN